MDMAYGIASGVTPKAGIYTAIVGGFLGSFLGGSNIQIGGPTGAFVVIVAGVLARHGLSGLYMVTIMAGRRPPLFPLFRLWDGGGPFPPPPLSFVSPQRHFSFFLL